MLYRENIPNTMFTHISYFAASSKEKRRSAQSSSREWGAAAKKIRHQEAKCARLQRSKYTNIDFDTSIMTIWFSSSEMIFSSVDKNDRGSMEKYTYHYQTSSHTLLLSRIWNSINAIQVWEYCEPTKATPEKKASRNERRKTITIILRDVIRLYLSGSVSSCCLYGARGGGDGGVWCVSLLFTLYFSLDFHLWRLPSPKNKKLREYIQTL